MENEEAGKGYVFYFANKYKYYVGSPSFDFDDLVQAGEEGRLKALRTHNPELASLSTHLYNCIRGSILDEISRMRYGTRRHPVSNLSMVDVDEVPVCDGNGGNAERAMDMEVIRKAVAKLSYRSRTILYRRYWQQDMGKDIAKDFGVSRVRVSQLHNKAVLELAKVVFEGDL